MTFFDTGFDFTTLSGWLRLERLRDRIATAVENTMPDDALEDEFTEALLFVLSIRLNCLTGGAPGMTFSARCHTSGQTAQSRATRAFWDGLAAMIDLYCAVFRGEVMHCRTAWDNHRLRSADSRRR